MVRSTFQCDLARRFGRPSVEILVVWLVVQPSKLEQMNGWLDPLMAAMARAMAVVQNGALGRRGRFG